MMAIKQQEEATLKKIQEEHPELRVYPQPVDEEMTHEALVHWFGRYYGALGVVRLIYGEEAGYDPARRKTFVLSVKLANADVSDSQLDELLNDLQTRIHDAIQQSNVAKLGDTNISDMLIDQAVDEAYGQYASELNLSTSRISK